MPVKLASAGENGEKHGFYFTLFKQLIFCTSDNFVTFTAFLLWEVMACF